MALANGEIKEGRLIQLGTPEIPSALISLGSDIDKISASETSSKNPKPVVAGGVNFEKVAPAGICSGVKPGKALFCNCGPPK